MAVFYARVCVCSLQQTLSCLSVNVSLNLRSKGTTTILVFVY